MELDYDIVFAILHQVEADGAEQDTDIKGFAKDKIRKHIEKMKAINLLDVETITTFDGDGFLIRGIKSKGYDYLELEPLVQIIRAIGKEVSGEEKIAEDLDFDVDEVHCYLQELENKKYIQCSKGSPYGSPGRQLYHDCWLTNKGRIAAKNPSKLIKEMTMNQHSGNINQDFSGASIGGGVAAGNYDHTGDVVNYNYGANLEEISRLVELLRSSAQDFPEEEKEEVEVHLESFAEQLSEPNKKRRNIKLKPILSALSKIADSVSSKGTPIVVFVNTLLEILKKGHIELPELVEKLKNILP